MPNRVKDIIEIMEHHFPLHLAASWDNCGLQVGSYQAPVKRVGVALELEPQVLEQALQQQIDLIITHHPLFFHGLKCLNTETVMGDMVNKLIRAGIAVYAAHTNLDSAPSGLNQHLAEKLNLRDIMPLFTEHRDELYKIVVFVPADHVVKVHEAMARAGAGHIGRYSACSFRTPGIGTFRPEAGSQPWIGSTGVLEEVEEYRLETVIPQSGLKQVLHSMQAAHPYEEVAYDVFRLVNGGQVYSMGRKGRLTAACSLNELARQVKAVFASEGLRVVGDPGKLVERVALISGSGGAMLANINTDLAEVVITGDVKYHEAQEALLKGLAVIDAGHQELERHMIAFLQAILQRECQRQNLQTEVIGLEASLCFKYF
jgi:dinuclear metal center YbgI/SA1388 family protein